MTLIEINGCDKTFSFSEKDEKIYIIIKYLLKNIKSRFNEIEFFYNINEPYMAYFTKQEKICNLEFKRYYFKLNNIVVILYIAFKDEICFVQTKFNILLDNNYSKFAF